MGEPKLRCVVGARHGTAYPMSMARFTVGRSHECDLHFDEPSVSARHAEMSYDGRTLSISDLASRNGITVNGAKVASADLKHGDLVALGALVLRVEWPTRETRIDEPEEWQKPASNRNKAKSIVAYLFVGVLAATLAVLLIMSLSDKAKVDRVASPSSPVLSSTLFAAAASGKLDAIRAHVKAGTNINARNEYGFTALHSAAGNNQLEAVKLLLELGADPSAKSNEGVTAQDLAATNGNTEIVAVIKAWKPAPRM